VTDSQIPPNVFANAQKDSTDVRTDAMAKYALGDVVVKDKMISGVVRAIFTTLDGKLRYAVENDDAVDFVEEGRLSRDLKGTLAA
jgi:hypothetical protein